MLQAAAGGPDMGFFMMLGAIFLIFYFLVIRPENKRRKQHEEALKKAEKGDAIVTNGGLHGKITGETDDVLTVEIATLRGGDRVRVKVDRSAVASVTKGGDS